MEDSTFIWWPRPRCGLEDAAGHLDWAALFLSLIRPNLIYFLSCLRLISCDYQAAAAQRTHCSYCHGGFCRRRSCVSWFSSNAPKTPEQCLWRRPTSILIWWHEAAGPPSALPPEERQLMMTRVITLNIIYIYMFKPFLLKLQKLIQDKQDRNTKNIFLLSLKLQNQQQNQKIKRKIILMIIIWMISTRRRRERVIRSFLILHHDNIERSIRNMCRRSSSPSQSLCEHRRRPRWVIGVMMIFYKTIRASKNQ